MSTEKTSSKAKKNDMAFVAPVLRKDYPIFMSTPVERKKAKSAPRTSKDSASDVVNSQQAERRKRMEQHKHRRNRRYPKKKSETAVMRKISEINEDADEELFFDKMQKGFTRLNQVSECSESDEDRISPKTSPAVYPEQHKKKIFGIFVWKPFSFRKKGSRPDEHS